MRLLASGFGVFPLSSYGGEGWGEEAVCLTLKTFRNKERLDEAECKSIASGTYDLKSRFGSGLGLADVVRHQALQTKFFHRSQMQPVHRAAVNVAGVAMLAKRSPEKSGRESAKLVRCLTAQDGKPSLQLAPTRPSQIPRQIVGLELDQHFQFRKRRHGYLRLEADSLQHRGTLRFRAKDLYQAA